MWSSFSDWLHSVWRSLDPSVLLQMALFRSFWWPSSVPLFVCAASLSAPLLMNSTVNSAAMNIGVHVHFWIIVFFRYIPRSGIARLHGSSVFSFLRKLCSIFHSGCTNLRFHQQWRRAPFLKSSLSKKVYFFTCVLIIDPSGFYCHLFCSFSVSFFLPLPTLCYLNYWHFLYSSFSSLHWAGSYTS